MDVQRGVSAFLLTQTVKGAVISQTSITSYHAKYYAHELTRQRPPTGVERLSISLFDACVDLNPHQIDAALFALQSPLSHGVILADEVGLGKTIEAGLVLCQMWSEKKRRLLVICPASIRKQWSLELEEKFNLPTRILDAASYRDARNEGNPAPLLDNAVIVTSINFASAMQKDVRAVGWDLVVIDEAHKLRGAYRPSNRMGQQIRWAIEDRRKLLLTATPLQNSLLELYGLSTVISDHLFGEVSAFRAQYMRQDSDLDELRARLQYFCKRTLRRQVIEYIKYTERRAITRPFNPTDDEHRLYEAVSSFLLREYTYSIPKEQRTLTTLILRKLLASSSHAIAGTLATMRSRLIKLRDGLPEEDFVEKIISGEELDSEYLDEITAEVQVEPDEAPPGSTEEPTIDRKKLDEEIKELERYETWARSIGIDTKSRRLLSALEIGFSELQRMGANRKVLVFTESRRTQEYLRNFLETNGYAGRIVLFNGTNSGPGATRVYESWLKTNRGIGRSTGSRIIDIRTALIEHFRDEADIMIATEAAAEGVNLQFCSLVINYDLPWNPQRIEQRIGRCHRYGQQHDVVVINFLNERNEADRRVLELLTNKFNLFNGIFGASDEILGAIESGVDFEKRILEIYQRCRTREEIDTAFNQLQSQMDDIIRSRIEDTRKKLLEHFDEDVHARLKMQLGQAREQLDYFGRLFWALSRYMLSDCSQFDDDQLIFDLRTSPRPDLLTGQYKLISKSKTSSDGYYLYRLSHPLGQFVIEGGKALTTDCAHVTFDVSSHPARIATVEDLRGKHGWLLLQSLSIQSFDKEEYLLFSGFDEGGDPLDQETCEKLFRCNGSVSAEELHLDYSVATRLRRESQRHAEGVIARSLEANNRLFQEERERLERWAEDLVLGAEKELSDTKAQIKALNRQSRQATTTQEQHDIQTKIRDLEKVQRRQRQSIFDVEDEITAKRDVLIETLEKRMAQKTSREELFIISWSVI